MDAKAPLSLVSEVSFRRHWLFSVHLTEFRITGKDLTTMYIVSATSYRGGDGDSKKWPRSGDLYKVECGPGTEMGKILGAEWKGAERHRAQL